MRKLALLLVVILLLGGNIVSAQQPSEVDLTDEQPTAVVVLAKVSGQPVPITTVSFASELSHDLTVAFATIESTNDGLRSGGFELGIGGKSYDLGTFRTRECDVYRAHSGDSAEVNRRGPATGATTIVVIQRPLIASVDEYYQKSSLTIRSPILRELASTTQHSVTLDLGGRNSQGGYLIFYSPGRYTDQQTPQGWKDRAEDGLMQQLFGVSIDITGEPTTHSLSVGNLTSGTCEIQRLTGEATSITYSTRDEGQTDLVIAYIPYEDIVH